MLYFKFKIVTKLVQSRVIVSQIFDKDIAVQIQNFGIKDFRVLATCVAYNSIYIQSGDQDIDLFVKNRFCLRVL